METRTYDAIVIGAGHNGLCLAAYLARAGLRTAIVERRHEEGGGINTEEPLLPGFRFNMHAQYMEFFDIMPMVQDFGLYDLGLRALMPEAQAGITFSDGRAPIVIYRPDMNDQTHASIARYSRSDADTFMELKNRTMQLEMLLAASLYTPPVHAEVDPQAMLLEAVYSDLGLTRAHALKSPKMLIDELFESDELRTLMYRVSIEWGFPIDASSTAAGFLAFVMWTIGNWKMAVGGTHTLAKAMTQACYREGVDLIENTMVDSIIVEDGRAVGVRTRSGDIRATRCMASNADLKQTMLDLVGEEHLSDLWIRRTKNFRYGPSHVLGTTIMCIRDAPRYLSAKHDPNIDRCFYTIVGLENAEQMARYARDAYMGRIPEAGAGTWVNSLWDPAQAPAGFHSATGWYFFPRASDLSAEEWDEVRRTYNDQMLAKWRAAAPNMTADNVIAHRLYTPDQMERKNMMMEGDFSNGEFVADQVGANRPFPEASNFRTEIDGLYLCGPSAYPGGGASAAPGYNAYKAIAEDLALTSPVVGARGY